YEWITHSPKLLGVKKPLRRVLDANEQIAHTYFSNTNLVKTFPVESAVQKARVNGYDGLHSPIPENWQLQVDRVGNEPLLLTMDAIRALPKHELVYDFKCVEGWSQIQHWGGARLSDLLTTYKLGTKNGQAPSLDKTDDLFKFVGMETPDKGYYVGIDIESAMHPQTLLAYELNGQPINNQHGAPVRLIIPVKYGVKNIKRIGRIFFSDTRPRDFWAERGYDYYVGL
ncbi:MAG: oxidoreductase molybdopterin binding protein, partial [Spirosoma sp.]|nr:oxidoreductase molybdopterin binding protein [Spirosoma sp.]